MKKNKVYIVNKSGHDFSDAERFGELVYLSEGSVNPFLVSRIYREFSEILKDSQPQDCLVISGLQVMNAIASAILARVHGRVNWLQWHPRDGKYRKRTVMIDELTNNNRKEAQ